MPAPAAKLAAEPKLAVVACAGVVFTSTEIELEPTFAIATSGLPSPSRAPAAANSGAPPTGTSTAAAKLTAPIVDVFSRI